MYPTRIEMQQLDFLNRLRRLPPTAWHCTEDRGLSKYECETPRGLKVLLEVANASLGPIITLKVDERPIIRYSYDAGIASRPQIATIDLYQRLKLHRMSIESRRSKMARVEDDKNLELILEQINSNF